MSIMWMRKFISPNRYLDKGCPAAGCFLVPEEKCVGKEEEEEKDNISSNNNNEAF